MKNKRPAANVAKSLKCAASGWWIHGCLQNYIIACVKYHKTFKECLAEFILMSNIFSRLNTLNHQLYDKIEYSSRT